MTALTAAQDHADANLERGLERKGVQGSHAPKHPL